MNVFVDTSALFAILDADDLNHAAAKKTFAQLLGNDDTLITTNYILVETCALIQRRLGMAAVKILNRDMVPVLGIEWISAVQHKTALNKLLATGRRQLSLVDWVSFVTMQQLEITTAFTFDADFAEQQFTCIPESN